MYGPFKTFNFEKGRKYDLPVGYQFKGDIFDGSYQYQSYEYVGPITQTQNNDRYLVFCNGAEYVFCAPKVSIIGNKLEVNMNPKHFGLLNKIIYDIGKCKWDLFCTDYKESDMPELI